MSCITQNRATLFYKEPGEHGQAMVELAVALVVIMALFAGLIQIARLADASSETMTRARNYAGQAAMADVHDAPLGAMYILNWSPGPDGKSYTADDIPFQVVNASDTTDDISLFAQTDVLTSFLPDNPLAEFDDAADLINAFYLVHGRAQASVPTAPVIRSLIYNRPNIHTESHVWLVWTRGIY